MDNKMFITLMKKVAFLTNSSPRVKKNLPFKIGDTSYIFHPNFNSLTAGEMISVETVITDALKEKRAFLPELLAILIRPCISDKDKEQGRRVHKIEPFDVDNLEFRQGLFMKELKVPDFITRVEAFMTGAKRSQIITSLSSVRKNQLETQESALRKLLRKRSH